MSAVADGSVGPGAGTARAARWARWVLVAFHLPVTLYVAAPAVVGAPANGRSDPDPALPAALAVVMGALQLRHSLAVSRGHPPRGGGWGLLALTVVAFAPMAWFGVLEWRTAGAVLFASALMVLPGRSGFLAAGGVLLAEAGLTAAAQGPSGAGLSAGGVVLSCLAALLWVGVPGAALYGGARLVRVLEELHATRTELAVGRERSRRSRELQDQVGQSLSAISLKGDLAIRLLPRDTHAARGEIEGITSVAREAMRDVRSASGNTSPSSLRAELHEAAALLAAAGIDAGIDVTLGHLAPPVEEIFAWAVCVGVAEVLKHGEARICSITAKRGSDRVSLEMVTDRARPRASEGPGLAGLVERVRALSGDVTAGRTGDGGFRLFVQVPEKGGTP